jgi:hypothetical protein
MLKALSRTMAAVLVAASFGLSALPADADGSASDALATHTVIDVSTAIKNAMDSQSQTKKAPPKASPGSVAQVPPISQQPVGGVQPIGLPTGPTYMVDASVAYPYGNIGTFGKHWLPGGMDGVLGYGFDPTTRFVASYFQLQHYPYGFNSGTVPLYLQGFSTPIGSVDLGKSQPQLDLATKDKFLLLNFEKLFLIGGLPGGRKLPIVVTPTYVSRWSYIAQSGMGNDIVPFQPSPTNSFPLTDVNTRTAQVWSLAVTVPFLKTTKFFGTMTAAPAWIGHLNGVNQENHAQIYQIMYLEYSPTKTTRVFFEPQSSRDYLPTDRYAQHLVAYFAGISQRFAKYGFVQLVFNEGGPTNESPYGVSALVCQQLPCNSNQVVPVIGGLKAQQLQLQVGIGSPSIINF